MSFISEIKNSRDYRNKDNLDELISIYTSMFNLSLKASYINTEISADINTDTISIKYDGQQFDLLLKDSYGNIHLSHDVNDLLLPDKYVLTYINPKDDNEIINAYNRIIESIIRNYKLYKILKHNKLTQNINIDNNTVFTITGGISISFSDYNHKLLNFSMNKYNNSEWFTLKVSYKNNYYIKDIDELTIDSFKDLLNDFKKIIKTINDKTIKECL